MLPCPSYPAWDPALHPVIPSPLAYPSPSHQATFMLFQMQHWAMASWTSLLRSSLHGPFSPEKKGSCPTRMSDHVISVNLPVAPPHGRDQAPESPCAQAPPRPHSRSPLLTLQPHWPLAGLQKCQARFCPGFCICCFLCLETWPQISVGVTSSHLLLLAQTAPWRRLLHGSF